MKQPHFKVSSGATSCREKRHSFEHHGDEVSSSRFCTWLGSRVTVSGRRGLFGYKSEFMDGFSGEGSSPHRH